jgi:hypothetical protein
MRLPREDDYRHAMRYAGWGVAITVGAIFGVLLLIAALTS